MEVWIALYDLGGGEGFLVLKFTLRVLLGDKMSKLDISHVPLLGDV